MTCAKNRRNLAAGPIVFTVSKPLVPFSKEKEEGSKGLHGGGGGEIAEERGERQVG